MNRIAPMDPYGREFQKGQDDSLMRQYMFAHLQQMALQQQQSEYNNSTTMLANASCAQEQTARMVVENESPSKKRDGADVVCGSSLIDVYAV